MSNIYIVPAGTNDIYAAGRDGNEFSSEQGVRDAIPALVETFGGTADEWDVVADENTSTHLWMVEVRGSNAVPAQVDEWDEGVRVTTSGRTGWCAATVFAEQGAREPWFDSRGVERRRVALYTSEAAAHAAVEAGELFSGQQYRVRHALFEDRSEGVVVR